MTDSDRAREIIRDWKYEPGSLSRQKADLLVERIAQALDARYRDGLAAAARAVPTSWLDSLLTGPGAVFEKENPNSCKQVEALLSRLRERILALAPGEADADRELGRMLRAVVERRSIGPIYRSNRGGRPYVVVLGKPLGVSREFEGDTLDAAVARAAGDGGKTS